MKVKPMKPPLTLTGISLIFSLFFPSLSWAQSNRISQPTILDNIKANGILKIGIRKDAPPFGYVNRPITVDVLESSIDEYTENGRFRSIKNKRFVIECGPNTIQRNADYGITYSVPFFYTGTYLLVNSAKKDSFNTNSFLQNVSIGVIQDTLTQTFLSGRYQLANQRVYTGARSRELAVKDAMSGRTDAFASDGVLLLGEMMRLGLNPNQYSIIPEQPLSCVSYGMLLSANDREWVATVNDFINRHKTQEVVQGLFGESSPFVQMSRIDYSKCQ
jgi:polar amino acid transport system substrate-binding protein